MLFLVNNGTYFNYVYDNKRFQDFRIYMEMDVLRYLQKGAVTGFTKYQTRSLNGRLQGSTCTRLGAISAVRGIPVCILSNLVPRVFWLFGRRRVGTSYMIIIVYRDIFPLFLTCLWYCLSVFVFVCHVFDSNGLRSGMAHKCACSKCIGRWPKTPQLLPTSQCMQYGN